MLFAAAVLVAVVALAAALLKCAAARATRDTFLVGWLAKLAYIRRWPTPQLVREAALLRTNRGTFSLASEHGSYVNLVSPIPPNGAKERLLLVSFAGGGINRHGGLSHYEMQKCLAKVSSTLCDDYVTDELYLIDLSALSWWHYNAKTRHFDGIEQCARMLARLASHYHHVVLVGSCMGGTTAMMVLAPFINALSDAGVARRRVQCVAFNPQTDPKRNGRFLVRASRFFMPASVIDTFLNRLAASVHTAVVAGARVAVHASAVPVERDPVDRLHEAVLRRMQDDCGAPLGADSLRVRTNTANVVDRCVAPSRLKERFGGDSRRAVQERLRFIEHTDYEKHFVARHLRDAQQLNVYLEALIRSFE